MMEKVQNPNNSELLGSITEYTPVFTYEKETRQNKYATTAIIFT
jgi:hypothetical protein